MKLKRHLISGFVLLLTVSLAAAQEPPKMKMTTPIPEGITTPSKLETSIGTLNSFDGIVDAETAQLLYDNLDRQRAQAAFLATIQISSMYAMEQGIRSFGPVNTTALYTGDLAAECAGERLLVVHRLRYPDPLHVADRPALCGTERHRRPPARGERRRLVRRLLWPESSGGQRGKLDPNDSRQELEHDVPPVRPTRTMV